MATPPKSTMPRRPKGSKHALIFFNFFGLVFFLVGPNFFHRRPRIRALLWRLQALKPWLANQAWKILSNELLFISNGAQEPELWSVLCLFFRVRLFSVTTMCRVRLFCRPHFWALFWRLQALKHWQIDAAWKILSNELLFISNGAQGPELWLVLWPESLNYFR